MHKAAGVAHVNASSASSLAVVEFLLSQGANPSIKNKSGLLAEDYARLDPALALALMGSSGVSEEVAVTKEKHGFLIGREGNTREEIQMECHVTLLIPPQKSETDLVKLIGRKENISAAKEKIRTIMASEAAKEPLGGASGSHSANSQSGDNKKPAAKGKEAAAEAPIEGGIKLRCVNCVSRLRLSIYSL